jgi:multimeric flavodoxin WrbA
MREPIRQGAFSHLARLFQGGKMLALAVNGSPRKEGNTWSMLNAVLEPLDAAGWQTELVQLGGKEIRGCIACYKCFQNRDARCSVDTDDFNAVMEKMTSADALILGSPTYFTDVSAEMKALIDRSGLVSQANGVLFRGKIGAAVAAVRRGGATHVFDTINHMFLMSQMIVPGSTYWNLGIGFDKGDVLEDREGMTNMRHLGAVIAWLGNAVAERLESYPRP